MYKQPTRFGDGNQVYFSPGSIHSLASSFSFLVLNESGTGEQPDVADAARQARQGKANGGAVGVSDAFFLPFFSYSYMCALDHNARFLLQYCCC